MDVDALAHVPADELDDVLDHGRPRLHLRLLGHVQAMMGDVGEAVAWTRPGLDLEPQDGIVQILCAPLDLARFEVPVERGEPEAGRGDLDDAHRAVPWPRHADDVLVPDAE